MSQTIIIESNREITYKEELKSIENSNIQIGNTSFPNNKWRQKIESGIKINAGDQISIEACMINVKGSPEETMEFSGDENNNSFGLVDNEADMFFEYYITNNQQFNFNLPLITTKIKVNAEDATESDFGDIDFSTFDNFKNSYPYEKIELTDTCQNAPFPISRANSTRMYLMNPTLDENNINAYRGWGINDERIISIYERLMSFKIDKGLNTPSNVSELITQQFHNRIGNADGWTDELSEGNIFFLSNGNIFKSKNSLITDQSFLSVSTSTGDIFEKFGINQWSAKILGTSGSGDEGDGYLESQGRATFYHNLLCGNPQEYKATTIWMSLRNKNKFAQAFSNPATNEEIQQTNLYTGDTTLNNKAGSQVGALGIFPCLLDELDSEVLSSDFTYPKDIITNETITNLKCAKVAKNQLVTTNIIYNFVTVQNIKNMFTLIETPLENLFPNTSQNDSNSLFQVKLQFGRANDQESLGIKNVKFNLPKPTSYNLSNDAPEGSEGGGVDSLPNSYPVIFGTKTYVGVLNGRFDARYELNYYSRYVDNIIDNVTLPSNSRFSLINPVTGSRGPINISKSENVAIIPVYYKDPQPKSNLRGVPFCAFISIENVDINNKIIPYPVIGEFFGKSPSCYDNLFAKVATTQKMQVGSLNSEGNFDYNPNTDPIQYMAYCMIGADNPTLKFGDEGRFSFTDFHCSCRGSNGSFQKPLDKENDQASINIIKINSQETYFSQVDTFAVRQIGGVIIQDKSPFPTISSQSGISISKIQIPFAKDKLTSKVINPFQPQIFEGTLFQKLGFRIEQLLPFTGQRQIQFNRGNYNTQIGNDISMISKFNNMIKPFTTNAYISGADQLSIVLNDSRQNMENLGATADNLAVNTNAESDELIAIDLPTKLDYAYLVVHSDIVRNNIYYGGGNGRSKISALGYVARNYSTGDYFYSFTTGWTYTADQDYILTDFVTEIMLPDGKPAPIEPNSSVIYKIIKPQSLPPPPEQIIQNNDPKDERRK